MHCPHCHVIFEFNDCITHPGAKPNDGDGGMCEHCRKWWVMDEGELLQYDPTPEEVALVESQLEAAAARMDRLQGRIH